MAVQVSSSALKKGAADVRSSKNDLDSLLKAINKLLNETEAIYKSDSGTKVREEMNSLQPKFNTYSNVVENFAAFLEKTESIYVANEDALTANGARLNGNSNS